MKRVLIICSKFPPDTSPESVHTEFIARALANQNLEIIVITSSGAMSAAGPVEVKPVMEGWGWRSLPKLVGEIRQFRPDAVLLIYLGWIYHFHPMVTFLPWFSRCLRHQPRFVTLFENIQEGAGTWFNRLRRLGRVPGMRWFDARFGRLLNDSDQLIVLSRAHIPPLVDALPGAKSKIVLIPPPPLIPALPDGDGSLRRLGRSQLRVDDTAFLVAYFGFIYEGKGIETLLRAAALTAEHGVRFVLIGDVPLPHYKNDLTRLYDDLHLDGVVSWAGSCTAQQVSTYLRAADICCLPFDVGVRLNNSSVVVTGVHNLPLVTTRGDTLEAEFRHDENVWLVPPVDPKALSEAILKLADDPSARRRLGQGIGQMVEDHFSASKITAALVQALTPSSGGQIDIGRHQV